MAEDIKDVLEKIGHEVLGICDDYESTLSLVKKQSAELVLLDIKLQGEKDGVELDMTLKLI